MLLRVNENFEFSSTFSSPAFSRLSRSAAPLSWRGAETSKATLRHKRIFQNCAKIFQRRPFLNTSSMSQSLAKALKYKVCGRREMCDGTILCVRENCAIRRQRAIFGSGSTCVPHVASGVSPGAVLRLRRGNNHHPSMMPLAPRGFMFPAGRRQQQAGRLCSPFPESRALRSRRHVPT